MRLREIDEGVSQRSHCFDNGESQIYDTYGERIWQARQNRKAGSTASGGSLYKKLRK